MLISSMTLSGLRKMLYKQLESFYLVGEEERALADLSIEGALAKCEFSFSKTKNKYYHDGSAVKFDPLHGCQWARFLYELSRGIYLSGGGCVSMCDKIYGLIKVMASVDLFYQVDLPDVFMFDHPLGAIMGRASYSNYFTFSQGCTVGNNNGAYPVFGESVFMLSNSKVIGNCHVGDNVIVAANCYIKDTDIPGGSLVFGESPHLIVKTDRSDQVKEYAEKVFDYE